MDAGEQCADSKTANNTVWATLRLPNNRNNASSSTRKTALTMQQTNSLEGWKTTDILVAHESGEIRPRDKHNLSEGG